MPGERGDLGLDTRASLHMVILDPGSVLGDGPEDILRNTAELGIHDDFVFGKPGVANDRQGDDFIGVVDEEVAGFLISHQSQPDLLRNVHLHDGLAEVIPFLRGNFLVDPGGVAGEAWTCPPR